MTNKEYLLSSDRALAERLVHMELEPDYDYDWDENLYLRGMTEHWVCPDGEVFGYYSVDEKDYEAAVQHTMEWLNKEKTDE